MFNDQSVVGPANYRGKTEQGESTNATNTTEYDQNDRSSKVSTILTVRFAEYHQIQMTLGNIASNVR